MKFQRRVKKTDGNPGSKTIKKRISRTIMKIVGNSMIRVMVKLT